MVNVAREMEHINELQQAIVHSPSYRNGMVVKHTGAGVEITLNGDSVGINEQNLILADAVNWLKEQNKTK